MRKLDLGQSRPIGVPRRWAALKARTSTASSRRFGAKRDRPARLAVGGPGTVVGVVTHSRLIVRGQHLAERSKLPGQIIDFV